MKNRNKIVLSIALLCAIAHAPMQAVQSMQAEPAGCQAGEGVIIVSSEAEFDKVLQKYAGVVVDFTASWCSYCQLAAPIYEEVAQANTNPNVAFVQVSTEDNGGRAIGAKYGVKGLPTFIFFLNGEPQKHQIRGFSPDENGQKNFRKHLESFARNVQGAPRKPEAAAPKAGVKRAAAAVEAAPAPKRARAQQPAVAEEEIDHVARKIQEEVARVEGGAPAKQAAAPAAVVMAGKVNVITSDEQFKRAMAAVEGRPAVIRFHAKWCPHCVHNEPIYHRTAQAMNDVIFLDVEEKYISLAMEAEYSIRGYPTFIAVGPAGKAEIANNQKEAVFNENVRKGVAQVKGVQEKPASKKASRKQKAPAEEMPVR